MTRLNLLDRTLTRHTLSNLSTLILVPIRISRCSFHVSFSLRPSGFRSDRHISSSISGRSFHVSFFLRASGFRRNTCRRACVSIRQHTSAYDSTRQHTSAYVSMRQQQRRNQEYLSIFLYITGVGARVSHFYLSVLSLVSVSMSVPLVEQQRERNRTRTCQNKRALPGISSELTRGCV